MKLLTTSQNIIDSLNRIGIIDSNSLLNHLPYKYEDMSYSDERNLIDKSKITVLGKLVSNPKKIVAGKLDIITFYFVSDFGTFFNVKLFNRGYMIKTLQLGEKYSITGTYNKDKKEINVISIVKGEIEDNKKIRAVYHIPSDIHMATYKRLLERTFDKYGDVIKDEMPSYLKQKYKLLDKKNALFSVHFPKDENDIKLGMRTLKYHECLKYSLKNKIIKGENKRVPSSGKGNKIPTEKINEFVKKLSFKLTIDQIQAIREIIIDLNDSSLMYRLLQGDVGTGKTIVAATGIYGNYLRNKSSAFMVPTDSLARQQYQSFEKLFSPYGIKVSLLIGSMSQKEKNIVKDKLKNGEIDVIVGTHALFSSDVEYSSLGLVVIDEQHRFGVNQRNLLVSKSDDCDLLLMSATPIPRTLALSIYGDLDISTLSTFPASKRDVLTKVVNAQSSLILSTIKDMLEQERQIFIVAPKISDVDNSLTSAEKIYDIYKTIYNDEVKILHGKMKSEEKSVILDDFINGKFHILVSTTVIELGINVLNAGAIIIYSSERFGLASLHQLRGRVGRNGKDSICLLVSDNEEDPRLKVLEDSNDGFYIAEMDMKMRGPGDTLGLSQSGFPSFSSLNIVDDFRMFECARDDATMIINNLSNEEFKNYFSFVKEELNENDELTLFD